MPARKLARWAQSVLRIGSVGTAGSIRRRPGTPLTVAETIPSPLTTSSDGGSAAATSRTAAKAKKPVTFTIHLPDRAAPSIGRRCFRGRERGAAAPLPADAKRDAEV